MSDLTGQTIGQYTVTGQIGKGGMATVYRATQASIEREVAIKVLMGSLMEIDDTFLERFQREVQVVARLQHPHILPVYDFGEVNGQPYIVMAYVEGGSLSEFIRDESVLSLGDAARIVNQLAGALHFAHEQGVIHRDVKPGNVILDTSGNAYLADFGLAKVSEATQLTATGFAGTPEYMAPDWADEEGITLLVDVYALGVTLFHALTGEVPYRASNPMGVLMAHLNNPVPDMREFRSDLSDGVQAIVAKAMAKSKDERYQTTLQLAEDLNVAAGGSGTMSVTLGHVQPEAGPYYYPNKIMRIILESAESVLGDEIESVLTLAGEQELIGNYPPENFKKAFDFERVGRITKAIYEIYGSRGAQSIGKRAGMDSYDAGLNLTKGYANVARALTRAGSDLTRLRAGVQLMARLFNTISDQRVAIDENDQYLFYRIERCPMCWGWTAEEPVCHLAVGLLQVGCEWVTDGKSFRVREIECVAAGGEACVIAIDKLPVDDTA